MEQKQEYVKQEFRKRSVLLVLDDCWDVEAAKNLVWIDEANTNSKVLISSRVRDVLEGSFVIGSMPEVVDVPLPSSEDAARMLLGAAGMREKGASFTGEDEDKAAEEMKQPVELAEAVRVADVCKRLPLTIGIAAKIIRQLSITGDFTDVVELLQEEMAAVQESSIEEGVIRASVKSIPETIQKNVVRLFHAFSLVPEDCQIPLDVLGMIYEACNHGPAAAGKTPAARRGSIGGARTKSISRLHIRKYLKVLIDRSLVLGTVDSPQLHDIVWEYVKCQMSPEDIKAAQRRLVESFRQANRSVKWPLGQYMRDNIGHHIKMSYDDAWATSTQAISWLDDHDKGLQDGVSTAVASVVPVAKYAKEAEGKGEWWKATLRWSAAARAAYAGSGSFGSEISECGFDGLYLAACAARKVVTEGPHAECTAWDKDSFLSVCLCQLVMRWSVELTTNNPWIIPLLRATTESEAALSNPMTVFAGRFVSDWYVTPTNARERTKTNRKLNVSKKHPSGRKDAMKYSLLHRQLR